MRQAARLDGIQYLRATAALMVVYFHLTDELPAYTTYLTSARFIDVDRFRCGVDIFFVISGFIMVVMSRSVPPLQFLQRRIIRIVPLYWALTAALALPAILLPNLMHTTHGITGGQILKSLVFVPYSSPDHSGELWPILVPGWTLNLEMYFYTIFAVLLIGPLRQRQIPAAVAIFGVLVAAHMLIADRLSLPWFYTQPMLLEFLAGMVLADLFISGQVQRMPIAIASALLPCGFLLIICHAPWKGTIFGDGIPALMIVSAVVRLEEARAIPKVPFLSLLGDASYSIYLSHIFTLWMMRLIWPHVWHRGPDVISAIAFVSFALPAVILFALATYYGIERPSLKGLRYLNEERRQIIATQRIKWGSL